MTSNIVSVESPIWQPFTQMKTALPPLKVKSGEGVYLELEDGRRLIDCISSWWVNLHGHANPVIAKAIYEQAQKLEHVIFAGFTHEPAEQLAKRLLTHLPQSLKRVFYSDNGSTSVEVALKIAYQYWHNQGKERKRFLAFEGGYHGDTLGAMSAGASAPFWQPFKSLMFDVDILPLPSTFENDIEVEQKEEHSLYKLRQFIDDNPGDYAAVIIEPLIQGAGGMRMCRPQFLQQLQKIMKEANILIIYDEVMTGFGRTGDWFACTKSNTAPDIICLSKGITGGFMPLAVTITTENIFSAFYSDDTNKTFFHGHSYTANPLACAAAIASMDLLEQTPQNFQNAEVLHRQMASKYLQGIKILHNHRFCGTIAAFDVTTSSGNNYFDQIGSILKQKFLDHGLLIRPLGNTIYLMPPYCITDEQLDFIYQYIKETLDSLQI